MSLRSRTGRDTPADGLRPRPHSSSRWLQRGRSSAGRGCTGLDDLDEVIEQPAVTTLLELGEEGEPLALENGPDAPIGQYPRVTGVGKDGPLSLTVPSPRSRWACR